MAGPLTAAAVITFVGELEAASAAFYEALAARFPAQGAAFAEYARTCRANATLVQRTYQETVTDALETGYAFAGLDLGRYALDTALPAGLDLAGARAQARALEATCAACYEELATLSHGLLATIPRAFRRAGQKRQGIAAALAADGD
jgi:hypothetical protein